MNRPDGTLPDNGSGLLEPSAEAPFFVYGTLMSGFRNERRLLQSEVALRHTAVLKGASLWHLPDVNYPSMQEGDSQVFGELIWLKDFRRVTPELDLLEGYVGPTDNFEYIRKATAVEDLETGETVWAYTYWSLHDLANLEPPAIAIPSGDWRAFMTQNQLQDVSLDDLYP